MAITRNTYTYTSNPYSRAETVEVIAEGTTLAKGTRSVRVMSDVWDSETYGLYWDEASQSVKDVPLYLHCEGWAWERGSKVEVDATPEVWAKVHKFYEDLEFDRLRCQAESEAKKIVKDSIVKVTRGRNGKGSEGKVVAIISRAYGMGYRSNIENKLGIATSNVMIDKVVGNKVYKNHRDVVWAWARNCDLAQVPSFDTKPLRRLAKAEADRKVKSLTATGSTWG